MLDFREYLRSNLGQAAMLTFAGTAAVQALIAIWAATSRAHWFVRALAVWAGVMLLVPIRLYEPAAMFAFASPLIVAIVVGANWLVSCRKLDESAMNRRSEPSNLPLSLTDVWGPAALIAMTIAACEWMLQGFWWFDPADFLAWCCIIFTLSAIGYDCITTRGQHTWQQL